MPRFISHVIDSHIQQSTNLLILILMSVCVTVLSHFKIQKHFINISNLCNAIDNSLL